MFRVERVWSGFESVVGGGVLPQLRERQRDQLLRELRFLNFGNVPLKPWVLQKFERRHACQNFDSLLKISQSVDTANLKR